MSTGDHIAAHLRLIRTSWDDMLPEGPRTGHGEPVKGSKEPPPPAPIAVMSLRREVCQMLVSWVRLVITDALDVNGDRMRISLDGSNAPALAGWLLTWADWLGEHDAAAVADDELGHAARQCEAIATDRRTRRFKVGPCIDYTMTDMGERVPCTGWLVASLSSVDDMLPSTLRCTVDPGHTYAPSDWRRLGERIHSADQIPMRYETLARRIAT